MRTLRLALAGTVISALLGAAPLAVAAQADEATATFVTGTTAMEEFRPPESVTEGPPTLVRGIGFTRTVDWSDPRLPATMTTIVNVDEHPVESGVAATWAQTHRLDGADGAWAGTERGVNLPDGGIGLAVFTGEGAYEGLAAVLKGTATADDNVLYEGYIYDTGLPPMADPIDPSAE